MDRYRQNEQTEDNSPQSPCIRNCCLDEKDICMGCFRSYDEILQWHQANEAEKHQILQRCEQRKSAKVAHQSSRMSQI